MSSAPSSDGLAPPPPEARARDPRGEAPTCGHQRECGGCALIEHPYSGQLETKQQTIRRALARFATLAELLEPDGGLEAIVASPTATGYRTRAKVVIDDTADALRIGLYRPGTHQLVDLPECVVLPAGTRRLLGLLRAYLEEAHGLASHLRHAVVRWSFHEGRAHLILVGSSATPPGWRRELTRLAEELVADERAHLAGVALSLQAESRDGSSAIQVLGQRVEPLAGEHHLVEALGAWQFRLSPGAFFQSNLRQAERVVALCEQWLAAAGAEEPPARGRTRAPRAPRGTLVDLYAGVAPLAIMLSPHFERVVAVESHPEASADARHNAQLNDVSHLEVVPGLAENRLQQVGKELRCARAVLLNPPRRGCKPEVLRAAAELQPERMAYVSCDPETLARDLDRLRQLGYRAVRVVPLDMFPQTDHVESVALIERGLAQAVGHPGRSGRVGSGPALLAAARPTPLPLEILHEDEDLVVVNKPAHLAVHAGTGHDDSLVARLLARGTDDPSQRPVPLTRLDMGASGVVLIAKRPTMLAAFGRLVEAGAVDRRLVVLARGHLRPKGAINRELVDRRSGRRQRAITRYRKTEDVGGHSLAELEMVTSGPHQAQRHLAAIGHPVAGDGRHGDWRTNRYFEESLALVRPFLHVVRVALPHPRTGRYLCVEAPLPGELELVLSRLRARHG